MGIANFDGLYGDTEGKYSSEYIFLELIATRSQIFDWNIKPHLHPHLFQVFIIRKGSLAFIDSKTKYLLNAPCVILIPPTHLHGLTYSPDVDGQILSVTENVLEEIFKTSNSFWKSCDRIHILEKFESFEKILDLLKDVEEELFSEQIERFIMLRACLSRFFINLIRLCDQEMLVNNDSALSNYFRKFQQNIKNATTPKSIPEYASELQISAVHLNRACNAISGKSASEILQQNTINEAQKYLLHTSYSISEIAYLLHFEYPNYFAKMFKKYVGMSPLEFRRLDRK
ncbi:MAG: helix-turn-helix domain-containing protein [Leadbetterella sp.]|jgi:AraC family transcriptional activator of pobA|nr:helix-turn-helix domain-containing protein [Leadbetterella sp.]